MNRRENPLCEPIFKLAFSARRSRICQSNIQLVALVVVMVLLVVSVVVLGCSILNGLSEGQRALWVIAISYRRICNQRKAARTNGRVNSLAIAMVIL